MLKSAATLCVLSPRGQLSSDIFNAFTFALLKCFLLGDGVGRCNEHK